MSIKLISKTVIPKEILDELEQYWVEEYEEDYLR
jgi:hypothetical protein